MHHLSPIAEQKSGDHFGETALVFNIDRICGVRTEEKRLYLTVHNADFENFLKFRPHGRELSSKEWYLSYRPWEFHS